MPLAPLVAWKSACSRLQVVLPREVLLQMMVHTIIFVCSFFEPFCHISVSQSPFFESSVAPWPRTGWSRLDRIANYRHRLRMQAAAADTSRRQMDAFVEKCSATSAFYYQMLDDFEIDSKRHLQVARDTVVQELTAA